MEFKEVLSKRVSIRSFKKEEVPTDVLRELVIRASLAPSINNSQPWKFIAIKNENLLKNMAEIVHKKIREMFPTETEENVVNAVDKFSTFFGNAPALIVVLNKPYEAIVDTILENTEYSHDEINRLRNYPNVQTIGAAIEHIILSAFDLGYGSCWLTGLLIARDELQKILKIEEPYSIAACVAIGKSSVSIPPKEKKSIDEIFEIIE
jgi:nitroreductase